MATILIKVIKKLLSLLVKATQWLFVKHTLKKQGTPTRTHPAKDHRQERYVHQGVPQRELPGFLFCLRDEPVPPATRQTPSGLPRCSSRQGWPGRMPVPDGRWLHRDKGKCLWTFSFCSNARSFGLPWTTYNVPVAMLSAPRHLRVQLPEKQGSPCASEWFPESHHVAHYPASAPADSRTQYENE